MRQDTQALLQKNCRIIQKVLTSPDGKELLKVLESYYTNPVFSPDPYTTAYRLGSHDLVKDLLRIVALDLKDVG